VGNEKSEEAEDLLLGPESVRQDKRRRHGRSRKASLHMGLARLNWGRAVSSRAISRAFH
jgi:hypothetical protein